MTRRRRSGSNWTAFVTVSVAVLVVASMLPAGSFTTATVERNSTIDVVDDATAIIGLDVASTVTTGSTDPLVSVTNNVDRTLEVTVRLDPAVTDIGDLVVGGVDHGDAATFTLSPDSNETVSVDLIGDCTLDGETLPFDIDGNTSAFDGTADRSSSIQATVANRESVVYHRMNDSTLTFIQRSGATYNVGFTTEGFGPPSEDLDCDGRTEAVYVDGNGDILGVDRTGDKMTLVSGDGQMDSRLGVGDLDGDGVPSVVYSNATNDYIYRVEPGGSPVRIGKVKAHSVSNPIDFDGDGTEDIVFTSKKGELQYYDGSKVHRLDVDAACARCLGDPKDFDDDGVVRAPYVGAPKRKLKLIDSNGTVVDLWSGADSAVGSVGSFDWDEDGVPDPIVTTRNEQKLHYVEVDGKKVNILDSDGNHVETDRNGTA